MGNFLTNLAKRSFTTVSAIRPHRASLFEAGSSVPGTLNDSGADVPFETSVLRESEVENNLHGDPPREISQSPRGRNGRRSQGDDRPLEPNSSLQDESELAPAAPRPIRPKLSPIELNKNTEQAEKGPASLRPPVIQTSETESSPVAATQTMIRHEDESPLQDKDFAPARSVHQEINEEAASEQRTPRAADDATQLSHVADRSLTIVPPFTPVVRGIKRQNQEAEHSRLDAEPTIHVTIGRVEVRAEVGSQTPSRGERTPSPVMSLDEYLRRRARRGGE